MWKYVTKTFLLFLIFCLISSCSNLSLKSKSKWFSLIILANAMLPPQASCLGTALWRIITCVLTRGPAVTSGTRVARIQRLTPVSDAATPEKMSGIIFEKKKRIVNVDFRLSAVMVSVAGRVLSATTEAAPSGMTSWMGPTPSGCPGCPSMRAQSCRRYFKVKCHAVSRKIKYPINKRPHKV